MQVLGRNFTSPEDMKEHMEEIKIYLRGHNLYDIFYGPFKDREQEILKIISKQLPGMTSVIFWMPSTSFPILTAGGCEKPRQGIPCLNFHSTHEPDVHLQTSPDTGLPGTFS